MYDEAYLTALSGLAKPHRQLLATWYGRLDEEQRLEAHRRQREQFKDWLAQGRTAGNRNGESNYAALLVALRSLLEEHQRQFGDGVSETSVVKVRKPRKQQLRASLERRYLGELVRLREEEGLSWRQLSEYFRKQFRKTVSHTYLKQIYEEHVAQREAAG